MYKSLFITTPTWNKKKWNESTRLQSTKVWIGILRERCLCMFYIKHNINSSPGDPKVNPMTSKVNAKEWLSGRIGERGPTKTVNLTYLYMLHRYHIKDTVFLIFITRLYILTLVWIMQCRVSYLRMLLY